MLLNIRLSLSYILCQNGAVQTAMAQFLGSVCQGIKHLQRSFTDRWTKKKYGTGEECEIYLFFY